MNLDLQLVLIGAAILLVLPAPLLGIAAAKRRLQWPAWVASGPAGLIVLALRLDRDSRGKPNDLLGLALSGVTAFVIGPAIGYAAVVWNTGRLPIPVEDLYLDNLKRLSPLLAALIVGYAFAMSRVRAHPRPAALLAAGLATTFAARTLLTGLGYLVMLRDAEWRDYFLWSAIASECLAVTIFAWAAFADRSPARIDDPAERGFDEPRGPASY